MGKTGRPKHPAFASPEVLQAKFNEYFEYCQEEHRVPNILGMVVFLECSRDTLCEYEKNPIFSDTIKRAKDRAYDDKYQAVFQGKGNPTIFIFDAVNNHDMINTRSEAKNKSEITGKNGEPLSITVNFIGVDGEPG